MGGYVVNFTVYTLAMLGLIFFAVFVYKKVTDGSIGRNNSKFLSIEHSLNLNPRKTLHIVRAGNEKFLIASDVDRTTLISKLGTKELNFKQEFTTNINSEDYSELVDEISPQKTPSELPIQKENQKEKIQLEHVDFKNIPQSPYRKTRHTKNMDTKVVDISLPVKTQKGISPMQEMARRINEL